MTISRCSTKIGRRSGDNLHALPYCDTTQWPAMTGAMFWKGTEAPVVSPIPIENFMASSESLCEWLGQNTLLVIDNTQSSMRVSELDYPSLVLKNQWVYGDSQSRWGMSCQTSDGGVAAAVWAEAIKGQDNQLWIDLAYRPASGAPWSQRFKLAGLVNQLNAPVPHMLSMCQGTDGLLYVFCTRDSAGIISMTRFRRGTGSSWEMVDHAQAILPCSGELPRIMAAKDAFNNRIILGYQSSEGTIQQCPSTTYLTSYVVVAAVYPDKRAEVLAKGDWLTTHPWYPPFLPWPRQDGIYLLTQVLKADCSMALRPATIKYSNPGKLVAGTDLTSYRVHAFSDDGWTLVENNDGTKHLNQTTLPATAPSPTPVVIRLYDRKATFNWGTQKPGDQLQYSVDGGAHWLNWPLTNASPLDVSTPDGAISFRLVRS